MELEGTGQHAGCTHSAPAGLTLDRGHSNKRSPCPKASNHCSITEKVPWQCPALEFRTLPQPMHRCISVCQSLLTQGPGMK